MNGSAIKTSFGYGKMLVFFLVLAACSGGQKSISVAKANGDPNGGVPPADTVKSTAQTGDLEPMPEYTGPTGNSEIHPVVNYIQVMSSRMSGVIRVLLNYGTQLTDLGARLRRIENTGGSTFVQWGNKTAIQGTEIVYTGYAFGSYYNHAGNRELECIAGGERGGDWAGSPYHGDIRYVVGTGGNAVYFPHNQATPPQPVVPINKAVSCAVHWAPSATVTMKGNTSCPANWTKLYGGYMFGGHYSHTGAGANAICLNTDNFDQSTDISGTLISYIYGTHLYSTDGTAAGTIGGTDFPNYKWLKCAVCARN